SLAHVDMLKHCGILSAKDADQIAAGLEKVAEAIQSGEAALSETDEDIHMNVEKLLIDEVGAVGGKLHTGRSRNDQVALDMRLYLREELCTLVQGLLQVQQALLTQAEANLDTVLPGYTHLQRAQPVLF